MTTRKFKVTSVASIIFLLGRAGMNIRSSLPYYKKEVGKGETGPRVLPIALLPLPFSPTSGFPGPLEQPSATGPTETALLGGDQRLTWQTKAYFSVLFLD